MKKGAMTAPFIVVFFIVLEIEPILNRALLLSRSIVSNRRSDQGHRLDKL